MENLEGKVHSWGRRAREVPPGIIDLDLWGERKAEWWSQGSGATKQRTAGNNSESQAGAALPALLLCSKNRCVSLFDPLWVMAKCFLLTQLQQM